jgi:hypothetical protein
MRASLGGGAFSISAQEKAGVNRVAVHFLIFPILELILLIFLLIFLIPYGIVVCV